MLLVSLIWKPYARTIDRAQTSALIELQLVQNSIIIYDDSCTTCFDENTHFSYVSPSLLGNLVLDRAAVARMRHGCHQNGTNDDRMATARSAVPKPARLYN